MSETSLTIRLGTEELLTAMHLLRIKSLPGMGENPVPALDDPHGALILSAGLNSLRAREWVKSPQNEGDPVIIDSTVMALLVTCTNAPLALLINRVPLTAAPQSTYLHFGAQLTVMHTIPEPGVHAFSATVSQAEAAGWAAGALNLGEQPAPATPAFQMTEKTFETFTEALRNNQNEKLYAMLGQAGLSRPEAKAAVTFMREMQANSMVAAVRLDPANPEAAGAGFSLIESQGGFWKLRALVQDPDLMIAVEPAAAADCRTELETLMKA